MQEEEDRNRFKANFNEVHQISYLFSDLQRMALGKDTLTMVARHITRINQNYHPRRNVPNLKILEHHQHTFN